MSVNPQRLAELQTEREEVKTQLGHVKNAINACLSDGLSEFQVQTGAGSRTGKRLSLSDLITLQKRLESELRRLATEERLASGLSSGNRIVTRFR